MLELTNLTKRFEELTAVDHIGLSVQEAAVKSSIFYISDDPYFPGGCKKETVFFIQQLC